MIRNLSLLTLALIVFAAKANAAIVYSDTFDSGNSMGTASAFFSDQSQLNGLVIKTTAGTAFGNSITSDVSGSGYFLFNGTNGAQTVPAGQSAFYISQSFAVTANTNYVLSFYLTNASTPNNAQVQAQVNGVTIGSTVSALGTYSTNGWQQFTFAFNSGSATTESFTLNDLQSNNGGNDFGVDNIQVSSAVPEPSSLALCGIALPLGLALMRRRLCS